MKNAFEREVELGEETEEVEEEGGDEEDEERDTKMRSGRWEEREM